jgi:uncharacterized secreted protein with C-terminal beta-propeller domain
MLRITRHSTRVRGRRWRLSLCGLCGALTLLTAGCELLDSLTPDPLDTSRTELVAFSSCTALETHLKSEALRTVNIFSGLAPGGGSYQPMGFASSADDSGADTSGTAGGDTAYSTTNNQEPGVAEADIFQVDETHAFALRDDHLVIIEAVGSGAGAGEGGSGLQIESGRIVADVAIDGWPVEMLLHEDSVVVIVRSTQSQMAALYGTRESRPSGGTVTRALVFDVTDRAAPELVREVAIDGQYVAARRVDGQVYLVARAMLGGPALSGTPQALSEWVDLQALSILDADLDQWIPYTYSTRFEGGAARDPRVERASCSDAYHSPAVPGDDALGILSFDLSDAASPLQTTTIIGDGSLVYASRESIVVALTNYGVLTYGEGDEGPGSGDLFDGGWGDFDVFGLEGDDDPAGSEATYLHRFALGGDGRALYDATGTVDGWILNQFSISERSGYLRVATQAHRGEADAESMVFTLDVGGGSAVEDGGLALQEGGLRRMPLAGSLRGIGLSEDLYAVRFRGDKGYLVTFRQVDPLWIVDLSNPRAPLLRGELQVPGFSTYLHPIEGNRLLAIGRGGWSNDEVKLSIFDVSDADAPRALDERVDGDDSEALDEHRAFRYIADRQLLAVPIADGSAAGLHLYRVGNTLEPVGVIDHATLSGTGGSESIRRAYRIGDYLYAYSHNCVTITHLDTLQTAAVVALD